MTFAADWFTVTSERDQPSAVLTPIFVDGERRLLHQYVYRPLLDILRENNLLERGKEVEISRTDDEHGHYQVAWLEDGERKTAEVKAQTFRKQPAYDPANDLLQQLRPPNQLESSDEEWAENLHEGG